MALMEKNAYQDARTFLDSLQVFKIKLGLDSMTAFMESLDNPHLQYPCIHIGGTNGKGSVGATMLSILSGAGYRVGFYTSPHLSSVRERFRIGDTFISRDDFARQAKKIIHILDGRQITYFEFTTALAMLWFAEKGVDLAIFEVGLGGRLDATNIVTPLVSIITNVSMDHEQHLGHTIAEIAAEKAGIIKPGVPVVTGMSDLQAFAVIAGRAKEMGSPLYTLGNDFSGSRLNGQQSVWSYRGLSAHDAKPQVDSSELPLNMKGGYQVPNASLALASLELVHPRFPVTGVQVRKGLAQIHWPGRLEEFWRNPSGQIRYRNKTEITTACHFLLDGAHNPAGALELKNALAHEFSYDRLILVWASMADKDISSTLLQIAPLAEKIIFTRPDAERSAKPDQLFALLPEKLQAKAVCIDSVSLALACAMTDCVPGSMICVAGSLYLVGRARQILCGNLVRGE